MWSRLLSVGFGIVASTAFVLADDSKIKVKEGDAFPVVALKAAQVEKIPGKKAGETVDIKDLKGKTVVIFFYPKAMTPGCTVESCGFRDESAKFPKDAVLIGASADGEELQKKFIDKEKLPYALLCDTELKLIQALGIQSPKGKTSQRITFVIDKEGKISKIYDKVTPKEHPAEVLKYVESLK